MIAEFMGYRVEVVKDGTFVMGFHPNEKSYTFASWVTLNETTDEVINEFWNRRFASGYFNYDSDWNLLIPVVEKIESIHDDHHGYFGVHIYSNSCTIQGTNLNMAIEGSIDYVYMSDPNAILPTKIESTFYNVVAFIKFYNANLF